MNVKHTLLTLNIACLAFLSSKAATGPDTSGVRSDTIDILHYTINLNVTDFVTDTIRGNTVVQFTPKMNGIKTLTLDLQHLKVDSIIIGNAQMTYSRDTLLMVITLPAIKNIGDTTNVTVYYHGQPVADAMGGGFYFQYPFAFNMGEATSIYPLCFGRSWYPCFDNFRERATYSFNITTDSGKIANCNGYLAKDTTTGTLRTRSWVMTHTLPSYLASVDVAPYIHVNDTFKGMDTIPIVIAAVKLDSVKISGTFNNLKTAIGAYQQCFGKYAWNKIGYTEVAAYAGSMEHATNIAYAANLFVPSDDVIVAHELSHHWFGDEVTCWAASDMWLNEGLATYCDILYTNYARNYATYRSNLRSNHEQVLQFGYLYDNGFRSLSNMAGPYVFGYTTYNKGGDVAATLRGYLGDSNFFNGLKYYLGAHAYQPVTPDTLRKSLERYSGVSLSDFFNDWVYAPGFAQFSIDSMAVAPSGPNYSVTTYIKQKLDHAPAYYNNVPVQLTFKSGIKTGTSKIVNVSGQHSLFNFTLPFKPVFAGLNLNEAIQAEAIAPDTLVIYTTGTYNATSNSQLFYLNVSAISDTAFLFVEHNFVAPDPIKDTSLHYRMSPNHYWKISGIYPSTFKATARFYYDGRKAFSGTGYLDTALTMYTRDSILLLYRKDVAHEWKEFPAYTKTNVGPATNMTGYFTVDSLPQGEYVFANGVSHVLQGVAKITPEEELLKAYPNPASSEITIQLDQPAYNSKVFVYGIQGKLVQIIDMNNGHNSCFVPTNNWSNGTYLLSLRKQNKEIATKQVIIQH